jgi:glycosyltransferase involved in cell wall biosynthesis
MSGRALRVVVDATQVDNQNLGSGQFRYARDLLAGLAATPDIALTLLGTRARAADDLRVPCEYVPLPPYSGAGYYYRDLARLTWLILKHRAHVFHELHTNIQPVAPCPVVVTAYHYFADPVLRSTRPYRYYQWALRRADAVIPISNATRDDLHSRFAVPLERMRTVYLGLSGSLDVAGDLPPGRPYILSPYNLAEPKNLRSLITAWPSIAALHPDLELRLYGRSQVTPAAESAFEALLAGLPHADRIRRLGHVGDEMLAGLYAGCAVFVFPTTIEGFGYPLLEAMAHGKACVARNASAMREVGGDAVTLVETLNPGEISAAVNALLADPEACRRLGERARARAARFSVDRMVRETVDIYRSVAAGRPLSGPAVV